MARLRAVAGSPAEGHGGGHRKGGEEALSTVLPEGIDPASPVAAAEFEAEARADGQPAAFRPGEFVEYHSATAGRWIPAKVIKVNPGGTYNLDCKPEVPHEKVRRPVPKEDSSTPVVRGGIQYAIGDRVEYLSTTTRSWIPAKVVARTPIGTYDLDCKPGVHPDKMRKAGFGPRSAPGGPGGGHPSASSSAGTARLPLAHTGAEATSGGAGSAALEAPLQLVSVTRSSGGGWKYEVSEEAARYFERQAGDRPLSVVSVCGPRRTGKSYLLNLLLERVQRGKPLQHISRESTSGAEGLWLWGAPLADSDPQPQELHGHSASSGSLVVFLECEGFATSGSDANRDAQLMALTALLSSALVLNTSGPITDDLLKSIAFSCRFMENLEEGMPEASRPALFWMLRDFSPELLLSSCGSELLPTQALLPDDYLEQNLGCGTVRTQGESTERSRGASDLRQSLLKLCSRRSCHALPKPAEPHALESLPFGGLPEDFKKGLEAFQTSLLSTCHASPKFVGSQPLSCTAFLAFLRHLVVSMNSGRLVSIATAWDSLQHTTCGKVADALRRNSCLRLRALAGGETLPEGAKLPLTDEGLSSLFAQERLHLRALWDERAVGDETVKREYWYELEASLAREESAVRMQNARQGDKEFKKPLERWQQWLDDEGGTWEAGSQICAALVEIMDSAPGPPVARAALRAVEAAGQRLVQARLEVAAIAGAGAGGGAGAGAGGDVREALEAKRRAEQAEQAARAELQAKCLELEDVQTVLSEVQRDADAAHSAEREAQRMQREVSESAASLRGELERTRATSAAMESERSFVAAQEHYSSDHLSQELQATTSKVHQLTSQLDELRAERDALKTVVEEQGTAGEPEHLEALQEALTRLHEKSQEHAATAAALAKAQEEIAALRARAAQERQRLLAEQTERESALRADLDQLALAASRADEERVACVRQARAAQWDADTAVAESRRLKDDLDHANSRILSLGEQLSHERHHLYSRHEETRTAHTRVIDEHKKRVEADHKDHHEVLEDTSVKLLERERGLGVLEGKLQSLTFEADFLREQLEDSRRRLRDAVTEKSQHMQEKEDHRWEAHIARAEVAKHAELSQQAERLRLQAGEEARRWQVQVEEARKNRCTCAVQ